MNAGAFGGETWAHVRALETIDRSGRMRRREAAEYRVMPDRVGIMGFSAGGHLASTAGTHFDAGNTEAADAIDRVSSRPDFLVLCYPVVSFLNYVHQGSKRNLLGDNPDPKLARFAQLAPGIFTGQIERTAAAISPPSDRSSASRADCRRSSSPRCGSASRTTECAGSSSFI